MPIDHASVTGVVVAAAAATLGAAGGDHLVRRTGAALTVTLVWLAPIEQSLSRVPRIGSGLARELSFVNAITAIVHTRRDQ